jgi:16S rRNA G527 N7-methylase RsmG
VTLLEPRKKRAAFLRHVLQSLPLPAGRVLEKRAQSLDASAYDVATVRAVGDLRATLGDAGFLVPGGHLLAWTTEADSLSDSLKGVFSPKTTLSVPGSARRVVCILQKT